MLKEEIAPSLEKLQKELKDYWRFRLQARTPWTHFCSQNVCQQKIAQIDDRAINKAAPAHKKVSLQLQVLEKAQMEAQQKLAKLKYTPDAKVKKQLQLNNDCFPHDLVAGKF